MLLGVALAAFLNDDGVIHYSIACWKVQITLPMQRPDHVDLVLYQLALALGVPGCHCSRLRVRRLKRLACDGERCAHGFPLVLDRYVAVHLGKLLAVARHVVLVLEARCTS